MNEDILDSIDINAKNIRAIIINSEFNDYEKRDMIKIATNNILENLKSY